MSKPEADGGVVIESTPLFACPFCGNKDITLWPMRGFKSPLCEQCGATICEACMTGDDTAKQIAAWNTRHANKEKTDERRCSERIDRAQGKPGE